MTAKSDYDAITGLLNEVLSHSFQEKMIAKAVIQAFCDRMMAAGLVNVSPSEMLELLVRCQVQIINHVRQVEVHVEADLAEKEDRLPVETRILH